MSTILESQRVYVPEVMGVVTPAPIVVCGGMGGSALPALVARFLGVTPYIIMHRDYGLPHPVPAGAQYVAISYSGNTEETNVFAEEVLKQGLPLSIIASGGALLAFAKAHNLPYVAVPEGFEPRDALLATTKAFLALSNASGVLDEYLLSFDEASVDAEATRLVGLLKEKTPVFYSSGRNEALSYIGKIQMNETAKVPAFSNIFPEVNHNEMQGFDPGVTSRMTVPVFIRDTSDPEPVQRRMELTEQLLREKGIEAIRVTLPEGSRADTFLYGWWLMRTVAQRLAIAYGVVPDATPLIARFKEML